MVNLCYVYFTTIKKQREKKSLFLWPEVSFFSESLKHSTQDFFDVGETGWEGLSMKAGSVPEPPICPPTPPRGLAGCLVPAHAGWMKGRCVGSGRALGQSSREHSGCREHWLHTPALPRHGCSHLSIAGHSGPLTLHTRSQGRAGEC